MHAPVRTIAPAEMPVSLVEAKAHLRVDGDDENVLIEGLVAAATDHLDGWAGVLGRALVAQTWRQDFDSFGACLRLPLPAAEVSAIKWRNSSGQLATVASASYSLRADARGSYVRFAGGFISPDGLAQVAAVSIEFIAGTAAADVPPAIKAAILLMVGHWYANREAVSEGAMTVVPMAVDALLAPLRRIGV